MLKITLNSKEAESIDMKHFFIFLITVTGLLQFASVVANDDAISDAEVVTVKSPVEIQSVQKLPYYVGISADTAGAEALSMNMVVIPPGGQAAAHYHDGFESVVYLLEGRVETRYGKELTKSITSEAGDFILIPPNVPHQPKNLSQTQRAVAIVSRNDPNEQESVVPYSAGNKQWKYMK